MLMYSIENEEDPSDYFDSAESHIAALCGWTPLVENIGHFIEQVKSTGLLKNNVFKSVQR